jgi:hypothetical protein
MISEVLTLSLLLFSSFCAIIAVCLGIYAVISIKAMERSTHKVEMVPYDSSWAQSKSTTEFEESQREEYLETDPDDLDRSELDLTKML